MKVGFITYEFIHAKEQIASSRIRARWLIKHWADAEIFKDGEKYDVEIFNKAYWEKHAEDSGAVKILDICDPDWIGYEKFNYFVSLMDAVVFPTEPFMEHFKRILPQESRPLLKVIPDRLDLTLFKQKRVHTDKAKSLVWFGYSHNMAVLKPAIDTIKQMGLKLTVVSNDMKMFVGNLQDRNLFDFKKYDENTIHNELLKHDIALLPPHYSNDGRLPYLAQFKSNNKEQTAWACGLPVAKTAEDLERFVDPKERQLEADEKWATVKAHYDVRMSVVEYLDLISKLL